jgi:hypothetical protein
VVCCGVVVLWCCGVVVLWCCGVVVLWCCGVVVLWCCGVMRCDEVIFFLSLNKHMIHITIDIHTIPSIK